VIYGIVIGQDGKPAKGIGLEAWPLGVPLSTRLPYTRTNDVGEYRFERIPWWGKYSVRAEDDVAGYSVFSTGEGRNDPPQIELTPEHPEAEMKVSLPPKAGFLHIRLTNRRTGAGMSGMPPAGPSGGSSGFARSWINEYDRDLTTTVRCPAESGFGATSSRARVLS
jgi:hypothetical protein